MTHELETTIDVAGKKLPVRVKFEYDPGDPGTWAQRALGNYPSEPPSAEIYEVWVRMEDGWCRASERIERMVDGDVDIYEAMIDHAAELVKYDRELAAEFRRD